MVLSWGLNSAVNWVGGYEVGVDLSVGLVARVGSLFGFRVVLLRIRVDLLYLAVLQCFLIQPIDRRLQIRRSLFLILLLIPMTQRLH